MFFDWSGNKYMTATSDNQLDLYGSGTHVRDTNRAAHPN